MFGNKGEVLLQACISSMLFTWLYVEHSLSNKGVDIWYNLSAELKEIWSRIII